MNLLIYQTSITVCLEKNLSGIGWEISNRVAVSFTKNSDGIVISTKTMFGTNRSERKSKSVRRDEFFAGSMQKR